MNKFLSIIILAFCCIPVFAKGVEAAPDSAKTKEKMKISWFYGGKIAFDTYKTTSSVGGTNHSQRTNTFGISPKIGIMMNDNMLLGLALWYNTQIEDVPAFASAIKELEEYLKHVQDPKTSTNSFTVAPHFRYKFAALWEKRIGIWGEARPFFSIGWVNSTVFTNTVRLYEYGFRIGPVVTVDITPKFIFETSFDILAAGWSGSYFNQTLEYDYRGVHNVLPVKYQESGFSASYGFNANSLFNAILSIGIIKKF